MPSPLSLFSSLTKKPKTIPFKDYYAKWFDSLKTTLLPLLHNSLYSSSTSTLSSSSQSLLSSHVHLLLHHFFSYYDSLDLLATSNPNSLSLLLFPPWRNQLERPFLFLGDIHPYILTNLIRSLLNEEEDEHDEDQEIQVSSSTRRYAKRVSLDKSWKVTDMAWKDPSDELLLKIDQIERGLRLMVPALVDRVKNAQAGFVKKVAEEWMAQEKVVDVGEAMRLEMEELVQVFLDANRLRRDIISDIVGALSLHQGALFLEAFAQFLVGFQDPDLVHWFKGCKTLIGE